LEGHCWLSVPGSLSQRPQKELL